MSAAFDATGERLLWFPTDRRGRYTVDVPITRGMTPYVRFGDWVPATAFAVLLVAALVAGVRAARRASMAGVGGNGA